MQHLKLAYAEDRSWSLRSTAARLTIGEGGSICLEEVGETQIFSANSDNTRQGQLVAYDRRTQARLIEGFF